MRFGAPHLPVNDENLLIQSLDEENTVFCLRDGCFLSKYCNSVTFRKKG